MSENGLAAALIAFAAHQTPAKITKALTEGGLQGLHEAWAGAAPDLQDRLRQQAAALRDAACAPSWWDRRATPTACCGTAGPSPQ